MIERTLYPQKKAPIPKPTKASQLPVAFTLAAPLDGLADSFWVSNIFAPVVVGPESLLVLVALGRTSLWKFIVFHVSGTTVFLLS